MVCVHILNTLVCSTSSANHYMYYYYVITNKYVGYSLLLENKLVLLYYILSNNIVGWEFLSRVSNVTLTVIPMILSEGDSRVCPHECNESLHT